METFQKEIKFLSKEFNEETKAFEIGEVEKIATFKELDREDKSQHKLHFKLVSLFKATEDEENPEISSDNMYDITVKFINQMLLIDQKFTAADKTAFLQDSGALLTFGLWLMNDKLAPFFLIMTGAK
jgi:hypothetical protein